MISFKRPWTEEIASITGSSEYQTAEILIEDWSGVEFGDYDYATGTRTQIGDPVKIYGGQARIIGVRAGAITEGVEVSNSSTLVSVRFQVPRKAFEHLATGQEVKVTSCPQNPDLTRYSFKVNDGFQGSSAATRTFEAGVALDSTRAA